MRAQKNKNTLPDLPISGLLMLFGLSLVLMLLLFGWSLGWGWLITRFLSFTLFESTLIMLLITLAVLTLVGRLMAAGMPSEPSWLDEDWDEDEEDEDYTIPPTRFWKRENERTAEKFAHYVLANEIYAQVSGSPQTRGFMGEPQQQELSIRLGELALEVLKKKRKNARDLSITIGQLQQQMKQMNLQPYDPELLTLAVNVVNDLIIEDSNDDSMLSDIIRQKLWLNQI